MNGFLDLLTDVIRSVGFQQEEILANTGMGLPGYFLPQKVWEIAVVRDGKLCAAINLQSQVGDFDNARFGAAIGDATDIWAAFSQRMLGIRAPWLGHFVFLTQDEQSDEPIRYKAGAITQSDIFTGNSVSKRYAISCARLVLGRVYTATSLVLSEHCYNGAYIELTEDLRFFRFCRSLSAHLQNP